MITAAMLARMQALVQAVSFDQVCTIQRMALASDGAGHNAPTWPTAPGGAAVACGFYKGKSSVLMSIGSELTTLSQWMLQVPVLTNIRAGDRVLLGTETLYVDSVNNEQSEPVCWDVNVHLIEGSKEDTP